MDHETLIFEISKLLISLLTPILILVLGLIINKKIERNKIGIIKEKEWQVRWAELFLNYAIKFNNSISAISCSLFYLQEESNTDKIRDQLMNQLKENLKVTQNINWDIQNFTQFAVENGHSVIDKQSKLMDKVLEFLKNSGGNLEELRQLQFEYNQAVRKAHNEILNTV